MTHRRQNPVRNPSPAGAAPSGAVAVDGSTAPASWSTPRTDNVLHCWSLTDATTAVLEAEGVRFGDLMTARLGIEPLSARTLAQPDRCAARRQCEQLARAIDIGMEPHALAGALGNLHYGILASTGNPALAVVAVALDAATRRMFAAALSRPRTAAITANLDAVARSSHSSIQRFALSTPDDAEHSWRAHLHFVATALLGGVDEIAITTAID